MTVFNLISYHPLLFFKICTVDGDLGSNMIMRTRDQCFIFPALCLSLPPQRERLHHPVEVWIVPFYGILLYWSICNKIYLFMNISVYVLQIQYNRQGPNAKQMAQTHWDNSQLTCYMHLNRMYRNHKRLSRNPGYLRGAVTTLGTKGGSVYQKERVVDSGPLWEELRVSVTANLRRFCREITRVINTLTSFSFPVISYQDNSLADSNQKPGTIGTHWWNPYQSLSLDW